MLNHDTMMRTTAQTPYMQPPLAVPPAAYAQPQPNALYNQPPATTYYPQDVMPESPGPDYYWSPGYGTTDSGLAQDGATAGWGWASGGGLGVGAMDGAVTDADFMEATGADTTAAIEVESAVSEVESAVSEVESVVSGVELAVSEAASAGVMAVASAGVMAVALGEAMAAAEATAAADTDNVLFKVPEAGDHFCHRCAPRHCCGLA